MNLLRIDSDKRIAYRRLMDPIIKIWPNLADLSRDLGIPYTTVASWRARQRIPADHDLAIVAAASARGARLTLEQLASLRRRKRRVGEE